MAFHKLNINASDKHTQQQWQQQSQQCTAKENHVHNDNPPPHKKKTPETQITTGIQDNQHNLKSDVACATESWLQGIKFGQNPT